MSNINIQGDGNAVGNGNRIFVDKRTINNNRGSDRAPKSKNEQGEVLGIGAIVLTALAIAAWKFAQHAPAIYLTLQLTAVVLLVIQVATMIALSDQPLKWRVHQGIGISAVILAGLGIWMSKSSYRVELTELAQTLSWKDFWCGLNTYGGQLATYHTLTMSLLAVPSLVFASAYAIGGVSRWLWFVYEVPLFARIALLQKEAVVWFAAILALLCFLSQLDVSQLLWAELYESRFSGGMRLLCPH